MSATFNAETHIFELADLLVDARVGVVESVSEVARHPGGPSFFTYHAQACNTSAFVGQQNFGSTAGSSSNRQRAICKALGEAVERYCAAIYDPQEFPLCSYRSAGSAAIHPDAFALYSDKQYSNPSFRFKRFDVDVPVRWTTMVDAHSSELAYVPAAMVYVPYYFSEEEPPICQPISTGLACHSSYERAVIGGICEVIERDAFTLAWLQGLSPAHVDLQSLSGECRNLIERFERAGRNVAVLNITRETGVPTILSVQYTGNREVPAIVVAAATAPRAMDAVRNSIEELALTSHYMQTLHDVGGPLGPSVDSINVINQDDHLRFWCSHEHRHLAGFLFGNSDIIRVDDVGGLDETDDSRVLSALVQRVRAIGYQVLTADLTTDDLVDLDLYVARVLIPGFHPLCIGHEFRALGGHRIHQLPFWAQENDNDRRIVMNEAPHPYP